MIVEKLAERSLYGFIATDSLSVFMAEKTRETTATLWSDGCMPIKIGKGDKDRSKTIKRIKAEYSAAVSGKLVPFFDFPTGVKTIEKIDDLVRNKMLKKFPNICKPYTLSNKKSGGEFILVDIKEILKELNLLHILKSSLTSVEKDKYITENVEFHKLLNKFVTKLILEILNDEYNIKNLKFTPFPKQKVIIDEIVKMVNNDIKFINIWAATRAAKTAAVLEATKQLNSNLVAIGKSTTAMASAINDHSNWFSETLELFIISVNGKEQDFNPQKYIDIMNSKKLKNKRLILSVDEADSKSHTTKAINSYTSMIKVLEENGYEIVAIIAMSATRPYQADKILSALKSEEDEIGKIELNYEACRALDKENTPARHIVVNAFKLGTNNYNFSNALDDNNSKQEHVNIAKMIMNYGIGDIRIPNNEIMKHDKNHPDIFIRIVGDKVSKVTNLLEALKTLLPEEFLAIQLTGKNGDSYTINGKKMKMNGKNAEKIVDHIKEKNPGKFIVLLSMGMATTSFSVKSIGRSIVFAPDGVTADIYQALHRPTTPTGKIKIAQMIVLTTAEARFKDVLAHETMFMTREEKKEYFKIFNNNGSTAIYNLILDGAQSVNYNLADHRGFAAVLDAQSKQLATVNHIQMILIKSGVSIGKGIKNTHNKPNTDNSDKGVKVDGDMNPKPSKTNNGYTDLEDEEKITESGEIKRQAYSSSILAPVAQFFNDVNSLDDIYDCDELWSMLELNKQKFMNLMKTNKLFSESIETSWSINSKLSDSERTNIIIDILKNQEAI